MGKMRSFEDYLGQRVVVIKGKYKCKKGLVSCASDLGVFVDLDYNGLRIMVECHEILILHNGVVDKKK